MKYYSKSRWNPQEDCPPDDICYRCGEELSEERMVDNNPEFYGFCSDKCLKMLVLEESAGPKDYSQKLVKNKARTN